jgi:sterol desaturase/sphingolipid hydroxylase (fatty acid hydroxylase superfamily)
MSDRDRVRQESLAWAGWYSPALHLAITSLSGLVPVAIGVALLHDVHAWQIGFALGVFLLSNAVEWRAHRDMLHKRLPPFGELYERHTLRHHVIFVTEDMAMRERRELRLVLLPAWGLLAVALGVLPPLAALLLLGQRNLAGLFLIVTMGYVLSYEWLHLAYHLPEQSFIGRLALVRVLRRHHAIHHHPKLMTRWNFNVSLPLWDLVRGTFCREAPRG